MMPRQKKDAKMFSIKMDTNIYNKLEQFTTETGMNKTFVVEKVLGMFFDEYFKKSKDERDVFR